MKKIILSFLCIYLFGVTPGRADEVVFRDDFKGSLDKSWTWVREDSKGWRVTDRGLEILLQPGNMWGPANNARNVLVRNAPDSTQSELEVSVTVSNKPSGQYEQVDLVWYYDDGHMVKLGEELVDGKLSIVMGREENDKTRTIAIIPLGAFSVQLRLTVKGSRIRGHFRIAETDNWHEAGECDLPVHGEPKVSLQCYQGPGNGQHWAQLNGFQIRSHQKSEGKEAGVESQNSQRTKKER